MQPWTTQLNLFEPKINDRLDQPLTLPEHKPGLQMVDPQCPVCVRCEGLSQNAHSQQIGAVKCTVSKQFSVGASM